MGLLESLTVNLGAAIAKAIFKIWLKDHAVLDGASGGMVDSLKKYIEDFETRHAAERLFVDIQYEVAKRLARTIDVEFPKCKENDREAAVLAVASVIKEIDLSKELMTSDLDPTRLEQAALQQTKKHYAALGMDAELLAELILRESCAYVVSVAGKIPTFTVDSTREILTRMSKLQLDLTEIMDQVFDMQINFKDAPSRKSADFETRYRRALADKLDRIQLFGMRLVGVRAAGGSLSVTYVTLRSTIGVAATSNSVDQCMSGLKRLLLRGEAGSGKTTLLQWIAVRAANRDFVDPLEEWNSRIPFYIRLRDYSIRELPTPERMLESSVPNLLGRMPNDWVHGCLDRGAVVLVDGIDELPPARRKGLVDWITELSNDFEDSVVITSSRPAALDATHGGNSLAKQFADLGFQSISLEPMSLQDSEALVEQWHFAAARGLPSSERSNLERYEHDLRQALRERFAIRSLASNPLLCAMICTLNWDRRQRLPDDRMELYRLALELLLETRDFERTIQGAERVPLSARAKADLLDSVAYWMLRNGYSEASQEAVTSQVGDALIRMGIERGSASDVLQDLLERSGVLRQPQHGVIDYIHRTFLEYMAARAAVDRDDFGLLIGKGRDESWRETIVFAAGHAKGFARDKFIRELLKRPLFSIFEQSKVAAVTTACCLETAGQSLDPEVLGQLKDLARRLFPPADFNAAQVLAPAARFAPDLLLGHSALGQSTICACIRAASIVGGPQMLEVVASYASAEGSEIEQELFRAWGAFDEDRYLADVIRKRDEIAGIPIRGLDPDALRFMQLMVLKNQLHGDVARLRKEMEGFSERMSLSIRGTPIAEKAGWFSRVDPRRQALRSYPDISIEDAKRISQITSLRELRVGPVELGALIHLASLPKLETFEVNLAYLKEVDELLALQRFPSLRELEISGRFTRMNRSIVSPLDDLRSLTRCRHIDSLSVSYFDITDSANLPLVSSLRRLRLINLPLKSLYGLSTADNIEELSLQGSGASASGQWALGFSKLKKLSLSVDGELAVHLPRSIRSLTVSNATDLKIENLRTLETLESVHMSNIGSVWDVAELVRLPKLKEIYLDDMVGATYDNLLTSARSRNVFVMVAGKTQDKFRPNPEIQ